MSWFYVFTFYFFGLNLFLNSRCPILFWVMIEINLISFCLIMLLEKGTLLKMGSSNFVLYYFVIQSSSSILFLRNFSFLDWGSIFNIEHIFLVSIILKIGLFPLFFWVFTLRGRMGLIRLFILLTFQKIPLFPALFILNSFRLELILFFSFLRGSILLLFRKNFLFICISSSITYRLILYFFFVFSFKLFLGFFFLYRLFLRILLRLLKNGEPLNLSLLFWCFCFFLGLPPIGLFFFKLVLSQELFHYFGSLEVISFWLFTFLGLVGYLKFFYSSFYRVDLLYHKIIYSVKRSLFLLFSFFFSIILFSRC